MRIAFIILLVLTAACGASAQQQTRNPSPLAAVKTWGYQLQKVEPAEIAATPHDLVVVDYSRNGTDAGRFTAVEVKAMQRKPDGGRRIVLAYMSIGEAEDYRFYWQKNWVEPAPFRRGFAPSASSAPPGAARQAPALETVRIPRLTAPGWLGRENEVWAGNYHVRFWYDGWQNLVMHHHDSYLARIQLAGFDGVYLDRVDVYYSLEGDREDAGRRMVDFVVELAKIARTRRPGFLVVPQNAEELLAEPRYVNAVDAIAKEDLLLAVTGEPNGPERVANSTTHLQRMIAAGKPVMAVEYTENPALQRSLYQALRAGGMLPYFGTRNLDRMLPPLVTLP